MSSSIVFQDKLLATGNSSNLGNNFSKVELLEKRIELMMMMRQHDCVLVSPAQVQTKSYRQILQPDSRLCQPLNIAQKIFCSLATAFNGLFFSRLFEHETLTFDVESTFFQILCIYAFSTPSRQAVMTVSDRQSDFMMIIYNLRH